ncbi:MAG: tetratricopeptide repeat protein [Alphaproteobacteria bacterium]
MAGVLARVLALAMLVVPVLLTQPARADLLALLSLGGLAVSLPELFGDEEPVAAPERRHLDEARAALEAGDIARAELAYEAALGANPDSIEGLTLLGLIREQQGRPDLAETLYRRAVAVAALREAAGATPGTPMIGHDATAKPAAEQGAVLPPTSWRDLAELARQRLAAMAPVPPAPIDPRESLAARLAVLDALLAAGLVDVEEHAKRRAANLGAILARSAPAPAAALGGAAPAAPDIVARFAALDGQLERGAITEEQWASERATILDALLPLEGPRIAALEPLDARALESFVQRGVVSAAEANRELATTGETVIAGGPEIAAPAPPPTPPLPGSKPAAPPPKAVAAVEPAPKPEPVAPEPVAETPTKITPAAGGDDRAIGIHLAWYRTPEQAQNGWRELLEANQDVLGALEPHITPTDKGANGVYFEVTAGPLASAEVALQTCAALLTRGYFCETTIF